MLSGAVLHEDERFIISMLRFELRKQMVKYFRLISSTIELPFNIEGSQDPITGETPVDVKSRLLASVASPNFSEGRRFAADFDDDSLVARITDVIW